MCVYVCVSEKEREKASYNTQYFVSFLKFKIHIYLEKKGFIWLIGYRLLLRETKTGTHGWNLESGSEVENTEEWPSSRLTFKK